MTQKLKTDHLFFLCGYITTFWSDMYDWLESEIFPITQFTKDNITFGIIMEDKNIEILLNVLFILGTFYIHKSKCIKTQLLLIAFQKEL